jgi:hypothetical protein
MSKGGRRSTTWNPAWNLGKTKVIRVPEKIADELMEIARYLDNGQKCVLQDNKTLNISHVTGNNINLSNSHVTDNKLNNLVSEIREIIEKIKLKESGFKSNSFGEGIKKLKELAKFLEASNS